MINLKEDLKEAVDTLMSASADDYKAMVRTMRLVHMLPMHCEILEYPELNAALQLSDERFAVFLQIVATRRDKMHVSPKQQERREYMRLYMQRKRRANARSAGKSKSGGATPIQLRR